MPIQDKVSRFGQHFMTDQTMIDNIIIFADIKEKETVIEIGTGTGILTEALAETGCALTSYEIDTTLKTHHETLKKKYKNLIIIYENVLKSELPQFDKIVANIPYNISEPLILKLSRYDFKEGILTVNKSFAEKMLDMEREPSLLSLFAPAYFDMKFLEIVPKSSFEPRPRISSAIISIRPIKKESLIDDKIRYITRLLFDRRTKKTENALLEAIIDYKTLKDKKRYTKNKSREFIATLNLDIKTLDKKVIMLSFEELSTLLDKIKDRLE
ncbi:MAG: ribosomal RNA small subunit methyltransferase A [Nanohaloarchaea archaeon]|nr:ribosomal RNA small subunit methyltransferase A [Candidatus Nanohaloarchaea archaeon]